MNINEYRDGKLMTLREMQQEIIESRLYIFNGNKPKAARSLGINLKTIYNWLHQYQIPLNKYGDKNDQSKKTE